VTTLQEEFDSRRTKQRIPFAAWVKEQPENEQKMWFYAAKDRGLSSSALVDIAHKRGARVSRETMTSWRLENGFTR